jgi:hypothetical protein
MATRPDETAATRGRPLEQALELWQIAAGLLTIFVARIVVDIYEKTS